MKPNTHRYSSSHPGYPKCAGEQCLVRAISIGGHCPPYRALDDMYEGNSSTPTQMLIEAIETGQTQIVSQLISTGVDVNQPSSEDEFMPPVGYAVACGHLEAVRLLSEAGAKINDYLIAQLPHLSSLVSTASQVDYKLLSLLTEYGADINFPLEEGDTLLHKAVEDVDIKLVEFLLVLGADASQQNQYGWTPIMSSICLNTHSDISVEDQVKMLLMLLMSKAEVIWSDNRGMSLLDIAESSPRAPKEVIKILKNQ